MNSVSENSSAIFNSEEGSAETQAVILQAGPCYSMSSPVLNWQWWCRGTLKNMFFTFIIILLKRLYNCKEWSVYI